MRYETVPWSYLAQTPEPSYTKSDWNAPIPSGNDHSINLAQDIWPEVLQAGEWLALGILVVVGAMWMFGNREPALRRMIDMCIGFEVVRHAPSLVHWLEKF